MILLRKEHTSVVKVNLEYMHIINIGHFYIYTYVDEITINENKTRN